jgi:hypothetical protein
VNKSGFPQYSIVPLEPIGLTKRELFVMAAMQGLLARGEGSQHGLPEMAMYVSEAALAVADGVLAKLEENI